MADNLTEAKEAKLLKQWAEEYGRSVLTGLLLFFALFGGGALWKNHQNQQAELASAAFTKITDILAANEVPTPEQTAKIREVSAELSKENASSLYASYALLISARLYVEQKKLPEAEADLRQALSHLKDDSLKALVQYRLAKVLWAQSRSDDALQLLAGKTPQAFISPAQELRGDILQSQGKSADAAQAYNLALGSLARDSTRRSAIEMKLQDTGSAALSAAK